MSLKVITDGELLHLTQTFDAILEEFEVIDEDTDHVFTTGAQDMIRESYEIIAALQQYTEVVVSEDVEVQSEEGC